MQSSTDEHTVWSATLDEVWECVVRRTGGYTGVLTVSKAGEAPILTKDVGLSYGAVFGPDVADVADWEQLSVEAVDAA